MSTDQSITVTIAFREKASVFYRLERTVLEKLTRDFANGEHFGVYEAHTDSGNRPIILALRFADVLYIG